MDYSDVDHIGKAYIATPLSMETLKSFLIIDVCLADHSIGWTDYSIDDASLEDRVIPDAVYSMANKGLAFFWDFTLTTHDSYIAYNFPTEDCSNNLKIYKSNSRRYIPKLSKKKRLEIEKTSAANELLYKLGIKNGTN